MRTSSKAATVAILLYVAGKFVHGEPDYILPGGPPPTTTTVLLTHSGKPLPSPTLLSPVSVRSHRPRTKFLESYVSSEFTLFGGAPPIEAAPPKPPLFRLPHPNDIPRGPHAKPFEVVRAPVIYHQTVTDNDVTKAIADAFDVVEKLRKPGHKPKALPQHDDIRSTLGSYEYVNHALPQTSVGKTTTTTTTIVEAPQHLDVVHPTTSHHPSPAVTLGQVTLVSTAGQQQEHHLPPIPAAADVAPPPLVAYATSAPFVNEDVIPVLPPTTTSTSPAPAATKLLIPSQPHVTTLAEAVQSVDPQVRTIIQPVYIPYPVDQNGRALGPLPDYRAMDFNFLLSAQKQLLPAGVRGSSPPIQILQTQPVVAEASEQPQLQAQNYYVQTDQTVAAADEGQESVSSTVSKRARKRIARRRNNSPRRL